MRGTDKMGNDCDNGHNGDKFLTRGTKTPTPKQTFSKSEHSQFTLQSLRNVLPPNLPRLGFLPSQTVRLEIVDAILLRQTL